MRATLRMVLCLAIGATGLAGSGCESKPAAPPPGAPTDAGAPPTVDLGSDSAPPKDSATVAPGEPNPSSPDGPKP